MKLILSSLIMVLLCAIILISIGCQNSSNNEGDGQQSINPPGPDETRNDPAAETNIGMDVGMNTENQKDALRNDIQNWIELYLQEAGTAGFNPPFTPSAMVATTPGLIFYDGRNIVVPSWEELGQQQKNLFDEWAGRADDGVTGRMLFEELFNWFFVSHEMTRYLQHSSNLLMSMTRYDSEKMANEFAVAFWSTQRDGEERLANLVKLLRPILANLDDPTPDGEDFESHFNRNYASLAMIPQNYGYYQFKQITEAFDNRHNLDFNTLVQMRIMEIG